MADGSLKFDTKIDMQAFDKSISTLDRAFDKFSQAVDRLNSKILTAFGNADVSAETAAKSVSDIGSEAQRSERQVERLAEQMNRTSHSSSVSQVPQMEVDSGATEKSSRMASLENQIAKTEEKIRRLSEEMNALGESKIPTEDYKELSSLVEKTQLKLDGLLERQEKMEDQGVCQNSSRWKSLQYDIDETGRRLEIYKGELQEVISKEQAFTSGRDSSAYAEKATALERLNGDLSVQKQRLAELVAKQNSLAQKETEASQNAENLKVIASSARVDNQEIANLVRRMEELKNRQKELQSAGVGLGFQEYDQNATEIARGTQRLSEYQRRLEEAGTKSGFFANISKTAFAKASSAVSGLTKKIGSELIGKANQAVTNLKRIGKASNIAGNGIFKLSNMFKMMLIRMAMKSAVQGVVDGMKNLVQYSSETNQSISSLMSSMTYLKNSFAAAFAPILSFVAPALNFLINLLATAVGYINQFFSALGGSSTFVRAKRANEDYAKSLKKTGGAASKAGKDAKKALAPFDDLIQIENKSKDNSGSGSGSGSADPSQMFETVAIDKKISDFAKQLKDMFDAGDWAGIGKLIGEKINDAVQRFTDFISWDRVGAKITAFVTAFTTMFNSLVATIDWYAIGVMMGTGINTLAHTLYLLLTQIDWEALGGALAFGLNGMVDTVDWDLFGRVIGAYLQAQIAGLYGFVSNANWSSIGKALGDGLNGTISEINWEMLGLAVALGVSGLFDIVNNFALTYDWTGFGDSVALGISTLLENFDWSGAGSAMSNFVLGILDFLITVVQQTDWGAFVQGIVDCIEAVDWIGLAGKIFTLFYSALGLAFGALARLVGTLIADGVMSAKEYFEGKIEESGGNVAAGILKGITDAWKGIKTWVYNNIFEPFFTGIASAFGINGHSSSKMEEMGPYLWEGFGNGIKQFFSNPVSFIKANITDPFVNGIKSLLGIHSPSTVMKEIGGYTVSGFNQGVESGQESTKVGIRQWAQNITSSFAQKLGISGGNSAEAQTWANSTITGYNNAINSNYTKSKASMETWAENDRKWFVGAGSDKGVNPEAWKKFATDIITGFANEISSKHSDTQEPVETWAENDRKWFLGEGTEKGVNAESWTKFAETIITAFKEKISGSHEETKDPMEQWANDIRAWFWGDTDQNGTGGLYDAFYKMAKRINEGFAEGIHKFSHLAKEAIKTWASDVMGEAEEEFGIHSPSREFYKIAEYVVKGFNNGISEMTRSSRSVAQTWLDGVMDVFDDAKIELPAEIMLPNAESYLPHMSSGVVIPPRAGIASVDMRSTGSEDEHDEILSYLIAKIDELIAQVQNTGNRPIQIVMNLSGNLASLARVLKPELDKEATRRGVSLVVVGSGG